MTKKIILIVLIALQWLSISAQESQIKGSIIDIKKEPVPNATIINLMTKKGTVADFDGNFTIKASPNDIIQVSFVGFATQKINIKDNNNLIVTLKMDSKIIDDVVVVGYGIQRKSDLTGAISSVDAKTMEEIPLTRVDQALQGRVAGVNISTTDGSPGGNVKIRIRGANSISGNNSPLYVVDGFLGGDINNINPNDIKSIEILKDASATAVFGSRGANGVVLITTKKGKKGSTKISIDSFVSTQKRIDKVELLDAADYATLLNVRQNALGEKLLFTDDQIKNYRTNGGTDWQDQIYRDNALLFNNQLSISGGTEKVNYFLSVNHLSQDGIVKNNDYNRISIRSNIDIKLKKWLTIGANISGIKSKKHGMNFNGYYNNPISMSLRFPGTAPVYNEDGDYTIHTPLPTVGLYNPLATVMEPRRLQNKYQTLINSYALFTFNEHLSLRSSFGGKGNISDNNNFNTVNTLNGYTSGTNSGSVGASYNLSWQNTNTLTYNNTFAQNHRIGITAVFEQQKEEYRSHSNLAKDFPTEALGFNYMGMAQTKQSISSTTNGRQILSYMGRINYAFKDKYLLTTTFRADGSSVLADGHKWDYFPSTSLAWRASEEPFIKDLDLFSSLKFRTSYGVTGSQSTGPYSSLAKLKIGANYPMRNDVLSIGIAPSSSANNDLRWEKTMQYNAGLDLGFLGNKITLNADVYYKKTNDLLLNRPLPVYSGQKSRKENIGGVTNKGIELMLTASPFTNDFKWDISLNLSVNKNEIIDFGEKEIIGEYVLKEGEAFGTFYGYEYLGVWQENERESARVFNAVPGDSKYTDLNNDNLINSSDRKIIGCAQPDFLFGINSNMSYKGFDLTLNFNGVYGGQILNETRYWLNKEFRLQESGDYYTSTNTDTNVPGFSKTEKDIGNANSRWLEDASYLRLKNLTLGYSFNPTFLKKFGINGTRIYFSGQNLFTITNYSGQDPEITSSGNSDTKPGRDSSSYPLSRIYTFGLSLNF
ncbi:TonB-dependent receptor [Halosquirtibacter xylanolyticus]|uniref:SusC/RagA family TonB-linked outer membrane protein n=1 Tax=Halosquirtibacter xylanolyticus TaxID=3374599 RepID=UPI00374A502C|nr:TonB-dependent receptor [Prolixibacteraceae bacterium]